ncbi:uncharacterized protein CXQ87_004371 [Candidozyma duobushaemuli]|uniref:PPPDE domain-containing protein n=1 Tax=Candidozyma duobushaemuli TaxID=1231522 RepID=A0A2V1AGH9_9ASCO|nr:uncharacterized protein CXQ87_004371 [[Candida] duobushaemulonis]PVH16815.1 hypothetical protein CXQ87_004371 [[Candida] duobushaemulonis]
MSDEAKPVKVNVYDLSHGLAAIYSPQLLGKSIDGIYHTSVVAFGKEYYIDQGIKAAPAGRTKYGIPKEVLDVGETYITEDILQDFLEDLRNHEQQKYNASAYDLFENNCNHFTDVVMEFLVGKNLEDRILKLPQEVLNSPLGPMLRQMLNGGSGGAAGNAYFGF